MSDFSKTGESEENDYSQLKKNIQEIIRLTQANSEEDKSKEVTNGNRRNKKHRKTASEDLYKQFFELKQFQKNLAKKMASNDNSKKLTKSKIIKKIPSEECVSDLQTSRSSTSLHEQDFSQTEAERKEKYDVIFEEENETDIESDFSYSDETVNRETKQSILETDSDSGNSGNSPNQNEKSKTNTDQLLRSPSQSETSSDYSAKRIPVVPQNVLRVLQEPPRDKTKEKQQPHGATQSTAETLEVTDPRNCQTSKQQDFLPTPEEFVKLTSNQSEGTNQLNITKNEKYLYEENQSSRNAESQTSIKEENKTITGLLTTQNKENKQTETYDVSEEQRVLKTCGTDPYQLDNDSDPEVLGTTIYETRQRIHLEIVSRETGEAEDLKRSKDQEIVNTPNQQSREKKVNDVQQEPMDFKETNPAYNKSDDELIRQAVQELEDLEENMEVEGSTSIIQEEEDPYQLEGIGDGDMNRAKVRLQDRIDELQDQIQSLRKELEEAKQHNQQEAREISYISNLLREHGPPIRSGLEWEDWELKEMVRERMREKREAAALDYQTRLRVVEALCSAELGKLENALDSLVPLNATAFSWPSTTRPPDMRFMTQDYFLEVITSMNLSTSEEKTLGDQVSKNGELPPPVEPKPESQ